MGLGELVLLSSLAASDACPGAGVSLFGGGWRPNVARQLELELQVELRRTGLCEALPNKPIPRIEGVWNGAEPIVLTIGFREGEIETVLRRQVATAELPDDALALALAAVAGELLEEARKHLRPASPAPAEERSGRFAVVARVAGEAFTLGHYQGGADVGVRLSGARLLGELAVGGRGALPVRAVAGSVNSAALWLTAALGVRLWSGHGLGLMLEATAMAGPVWLAATAAQGYLAQGATQWVASAGGGVALELRVGQGLVLLRVGAGAPLRGFQVLETGQGVGGAAIYLSVGGGLAF